MPFEKKKKEQKLKKAKQWLFLRIFSKRGAKRAYLTLAHIFFFFALLITNFDSLLFTLFFFLLGFHCFRRYFSLSLSYIRFSYPGSLFYLSHLFFLFFILSIKTSLNDGFGFLLFLAGLFLLAFYLLKKREIEIYREMTEKNSFFKEKVSLAELLQKEYFLQKALNVRLNRKKNHQIVLTNLRLLIFNSEKNELHEIALPSILHTRVIASHWFFKKGEVLLLFFYFLLFLVFLGSHPLLSLFLLIFGLVFFPSIFKLKNVLILYTPYGKVYLSGEEFNACYFKEAIDNSRQQLNSYSLPTKEKREKKLRIIGRIRSLLPPSSKDVQPLSFGLPSYPLSIKIAEKKRFGRTLFSSSYLLFFLGVFFYHPLLKMIFFSVLTGSFILFLAAILYYLNTKKFERSCKEVVAYGRRVWKETSQLKKEKTHKIPHLSFNLNMLESVFLFLGWSLLLISLLVAKMKNDGSLYVNTLFFVLSFFTVHKILKVRREERENVSRLKEMSSLFLSFFPNEKEADSHTYLAIKKKKAYIFPTVFFVVTLLILALIKPNFEVVDTRLRESDLNSEENPGWYLKSSETKMDMMKMIYLSVKIYEDDAKDEGYPAMLVLLSLKIPFIKFSKEKMIEKMREGVEEWSEKEDVIIEKEVEEDVKKNAEGKEVLYFIYNGTSGEESTFFTKGKTVKVLGAVWRSQKENTLHIGIGFAQVSNLSLNHTDQFEIPFIPNPADTTDETNWLELKSLMFKAETYRIN